MLLILLILAAIVLAQPSPPAQGIQIGSGPPDSGIDVRFPLTVTQCEPVFIYYNNTSGSILGVFLSTEVQNFLIIYPIPVGAGYIEWICNIPAGYRFWTTADRPNLSDLVVPVIWYYVIVQPGLSSSCLHDVVTTYQYASYSTTPFESYTAHPPNTTITSLPPVSLAMSIGPFPTGFFSTITVNPELIVSTPRSLTSSSTLASTTTSAASTTLLHSASSTTSASSRKSNAPAIAGGVIGGIAIAIVFGVLLIRFRRRSSRSIPFEVSDQPIATSPSPGWAMNQDLSTQNWSMTSPSTGWALNASPHAFTPQPSSTPTNNSAIPLNWDSSMRNSNPSSLTSGDVFSSFAQTGGPLLAHAGYSMPPTFDPQMNPPPYPEPTLRTHEFVHPQFAGQRRSSLDSASTSLQAAHTPPASGPGAEPTPDIVTTLNMFSRLPPEQMRSLFPVLENVMATQQTPDASKGESVPGAPPW